MAPASSTRAILALRFEPRDDGLRVHSKLDYLEGDAPAHGFFLLGHVDDAAAAFADFLQQLIASHAIARRFLCEDFTTRFARAQFVGR